MTQVSHQTIKLSRGKHASPDDGACVMELSSMLAGEPFTDHPRSVCPVIGGLLREYNDRIDDDRRQDLYRYASRVVGSRGSREVQLARADCIREWVSARQSRWTRFLESSAWGRLLPQPEPSSAGSCAVRTLRRYDDATHLQMLGLIDRLLEIRDVRLADPSTFEEPAPAPLTYSG